VAANTFGDLRVDGLEGQRARPVASSLAGAIHRRELDTKARGILVHGIFGSAETGYATVERRPALSEAFEDDSHPSGHREVFGDD